MRILGRTLGIPEGVLGVILMAFGVVFPIVGIRDFIENGSIGENPVFRLINIGTAILMFSIGYPYLKESLGRRYFSVEEANCGLIFLRGVLGCRSNIGHLEEMGSRTCLLKEMFEKERSSQRQATICSRPCLLCNDQGVGREAGGRKFNNIVSTRQPMW